MGPKYTYEQLIEKIIRAKIKLQSNLQAHTDRCIIGLDPEGYDPCDCGATAYNKVFEDVINELEL